MPLGPFYVDASDTNPTDVSIELQFVDDATGLPVTVTAATTDLEVNYWRQGAASPVTLNSGSTPAINDLTALDDAHSDAGILVVADGVHRFDLPDAAVAGGVDRVVVSGSADGAIAIPQTVYIQNAKPEVNFVQVQGEDLNAMKPFDVT